MDLTEGLLIAAGVLALIVALSLLSSRIGIAAPLVLVVVGVGIGYVPGIPLVEIDPSIILVGVLPPLLYSAAVNVPVIDLRRNLGPIAGLSVVLVIVSAIAVGALLHWIVPAIPFAAAVALGAVVAPTDAVAATTIGKRLGMPPRIVTILEGESLVNDATSLVLLRTAIAAVAGSFVFWEAAGLFVFAVVVAVLIGLAVGIVTVWIRSKLNNPVYDTVLSFAVPFVAFAPAEFLDASGVLAVVVAGLYSGHQGAKKFSARARSNERMNWRTVQFLLEHGVFLLMGIELHALITDVGESDVTLSHIGLLAAATVCVLIALRMLFMAPTIFVLSRSVSRHEARLAFHGRHAGRIRDAGRTAEPTSNTQALRLRRAEFMEKRSAADLAHARNNGLDWRGGMILSWSGMRGVVTLAAAQSIPTEVPYRSQLVLIAFLVAVATLLLHGLTLPPIIRKLRPGGPSLNDRAEELRGLYSDLAAAGEAAIEAEVERATEHSTAREAEHRIEHDVEQGTPGSPAHDSPSDSHDHSPAAYSARVLERAKMSAHEAVAPLGLALSRTGPMEQSPRRQEATAYFRLAREALDAQRAVLDEERAIGQYSSYALRIAEEALDAHELRLLPPSQH